MDITRGEQEVKERFCAAAVRGKTNQQQHDNVSPCDLRDTCDLPAPHRTSEKTAVLPVADSNYYEIFLI